MRLRPGIKFTDAINELERLLVDVGSILTNVQSIGVNQLHRDYLDWVGRAERLLRTLFIEPDLAEGLSSDRYWHIETRLDQRVAHMIASELRVQFERLSTALDHLKVFMPLRDLQGLPLLLDTNVLLHFDPFSERIDEARWRTITRAPRGAEFRAVIPHLVLDELDARTYAADKKLRNRARYVLRYLDQFLDDILSGKQHEIRPGVSWMTVEILPDAHGHQRQPDNDLELLDRAEFLHQLTGQRVRFVTGDRGMRVRGVVRALLPARSGVQMVAMPEDLRLPDDWVPR